MYYVKHMNKDLNFQNKWTTCCNNQNYDIYESSSWTINKWTQNVTTIIWYFAISLEKKNEKMSTDKENICCAANV